MINAHCKLHTANCIESQTAAEIVSFLSFQTDYVNFYLKKIILDSNKFQAIQTAVFYKKATFNMLRCNLGLLSKTKMKAKEKIAC